MKFQNSNLRLKEMPIYYKLIYANKKGKPKNNLYTSLENYENYSGLDNFFLEIDEK